MTPGDPPDVARLGQELESRQNLLLGAVAGAVASLAGAALWALVTVATGVQIGLMAVGVGILVAYAVRWAGRGVTAVFGVVGAAFALFGCALGNGLAVMVLASGEGAAGIQERMIALFHPIDVVFYAIALYEGYRLSFHRLGYGELRRVIEAEADEG